MGSINKSVSETYFIKREICPACSGQNHNVIYSSGFLEPPIKQGLESLFAPVGHIEFEYLSQARFILAECFDCGLIYQQEIPDDFLTDKIYQEWIDPQKTFDNHQQADNLGHLAQYAQEIMMLIAYFGGAPSQLKFFDFGMGWGKWCYMAKAFGCESYGTELSEVRIAHARSQGISVISWNEIADHRFDFINTEQVLEHLPYPLEILCYLKNSLKPDGLIKISVPDGRNIKKRLNAWGLTRPLTSTNSSEFPQHSTPPNCFNLEVKNSLNPVSPLSHINCFSYSSIVNMAGKAGLELTKIPVAIQFTSSTNWKPLKPLLKNIFRPLYRNMIQKGTYLFFRLK
jgi:hypothetical protein